MIVFSGHRQLLVQEQQMEGEMDGQLVGELEEKHVVVEQQVEVEVEDDTKSPHSALFSRLQATQEPVLVDFSGLNFRHCYIFGCAGTDLEEENCFIQPPFSDFLVKKTFST